MDVRHLRGAGSLGGAVTSEAIVVPARVMTNRTDHIGKEDIRGKLKETEITCDKKCKQCKHGPMTLPVTMKLSRERRKHELCVHGRPTALTASFHLNGPACARRSWEGKTDRRTFKTAELHLPVLTCLAAACAGTAQVCECVLIAAQRAGRRPHAAHRNHSKLSLSTHGLNVTVFLV